MRRLVAALLAVAFVALAWAPHVHAGARAENECAACIVRTAEPAPDQPLVLGPAPAERAPAAVAPVQPLAAGAPLGAVPGQSPPAHA
ncbi:MAG TPA: hypothetical protein VEB43_04675 [Anaeromyxobacter sp.]|nr:hypothetical protein [Anaeromyxobacter sp.]